MTLTTLPVVTAVCCREWPVCPGVRVGHCRFCGERPVLVPRGTDGRWEEQIPVRVAPPVVIREVVE